MAQNKNRAPLTFDANKVMPQPAVEAASGDHSAAAQTRLRSNEQTSLRSNETTNDMASKKGSRHIATQEKVGREGRNFIAAHVMPEAAKQFKMLALQLDMTKQDLLIEAINDIFAKHKMSRIA